MIFEHNTKYSIKFENGNLNLGLQTDYTIATSTVRTSIHTTKLGMQIRYCGENMKMKMEEGFAKKKPLNLKYMRNIFQPKVGDFRTNWE